MADPNPNPEPTNPAAKMSIDELTTKNLELETKVNTLTVDLEKATKQLDEANAILNAQTRKALIGKAKALTTIPESELGKLEIDALENIVDVASKLNRTNAKSVRFAADEETPSKVKINLFEGQPWAKRS